MGKSKQYFSHPIKYVDKDFHIDLIPNTEVKIKYKDQVDIIHQDGGMLVTFLAPHGYEFKIKDQAVSVYKIEESEEV